MVKGAKAFEFKSSIIGYKTHNDEKFGSSGHLQGYITADYDSLVERLGNPHESDGYKTDAEWDIKFSDGMTCHIYNYKTGVNYLGSDEGLEKEEITEWNVGGNDKEALHRVMALMKSHIMIESRDYYADVKVEWGVQHNTVNKSHFIEILKEQYKQDYNIELSDDEIRNVQRA